jgi:hypothetical protein
VSSFHLFRGCNSNDAEDTQYDRCIAYRILSPVGLIVVSLVLVFSGLTGCVDSPTPYRPPAITFQPTPSPLASATPTSTSLPIETPLAIATPSCMDNLTFLEDISIRDGTVAHPGDRIDKRWLVMNSGSCNWDDRYRLKLISGLEFNAPVEQALYPARSETKASIRIQFTAPSDPGNYQSTWQAYDPQEKPFGDPIIIQIAVDSDTT